MGEAAARSDSPTMQRVTDRKKKTPSWAVSASGAPAELVIGADDNDDDDLQLSPSKAPGETKVHGKKAALEALKSGSRGDSGDEGQVSSQRAGEDDVLSSAHVLTLSGKVSDSAEVDHLAPPPPRPSAGHLHQPRGSAPRGSGARPSAATGQGWTLRNDGIIGGGGGTPDVVTLRPSTRDAARIAAGRGAGPSHGRYDDISLSDSDDEDGKK